MGELLEVLEAHGEVRRRGDRWFWSGEAYPAADVGLRSAGTRRGGDPLGTRRGG